MSELDRLVEEFFSYWWQANPTLASAVGIHTRDDQLEHYDEAARLEHSRHCREYLLAFERTTPQDLGESIDRELITGQLRWELADLEQVHSYARNPLVYLERPLTVLYLMAVRQYAPAAERARAAAERLLALPRVLEEARANLSDAAPVFVATAAEVARSGLGLIERVLPPYLGAAVEDDRSEFARWENATRTAERALLEFARWLEEELAPRARGDFALGTRAFEAKLRDLHGIEDSAAELLAYGAALKRETEQRLADVATQLGRGGDWRQLAEELKDDHPAADELIEAYAAEMERARAFVIERKLATIPAGETLEITATPEYLRPIIPYAAYQPPAPHEQEQKGLFFVTPPPPDSGKDGLRAHARAGITVTALHEAYPGHHLQLTRANRADSEPRRIFGTPVFAEGWAFYCEEMMWEQGFYPQPAHRLSQLKDLLWRACRVLTDVSLHTGRWTVGRAVEFLINDAGLEPHNAEIEVRRYCAEPTQPLSYAVGKREILRLREGYRAARGAAFSLREFHDRLLGWGTIPPRLVERGLALG